MKNVMKNKPRIVRNRSSNKTNLPLLVDRFTAFAVTGKQAAQGLSLLADSAAANKALAGILMKRLSERIYDGMGQEQFNGLVEEQRAIIGI